MYVSAHHVPLLASSHKVIFRETFDSTENFLKNKSGVAHLNNLGVQGTPCSRVTYAPSSSGTPVIETSVPINDTNRLEYTLEYYLFFEPGFEWVKGGKLPGFRGGPLSVSTTGCVKPQPKNAWSYRLMWKQNGNVCLYIYDQSRLINHDDCGVVTQTTNPVFKVGQWHRLQLYVKLNSQANANDGAAELWVDNIKALERKNIPFRGDNAPMVDHILFSTFYGGHDSSWSPSKTTYIRFDNFTLYKGRALNIAAG